MSDENKETRVIPTGSEIKSYTPPPPPPPTVKPQSLPPATPKTQEKPPKR